MIADLRRNREKEIQAVKLGGCQGSSRDTAPDKPRCQTSNVAGTMVEPRVGSGGSLVSDSHGSCLLARVPALF